MFKEAFDFLAGIDPQLPWAVLPVVAFAVVYLVRKYFPAQWDAFSNALPFLSGDTGPVLAAVRKAYQMLPSALIGATIPAVMSGGDLRLALYGAAWSLLAPVLHEIAAWAPWLPYKGEVKRDAKPPSLTPPSGDIMIAFLICLIPLAGLTACGFNDPASPDSCKAKTASIEAKCALSIEACASEDCVNAQRAICKRKVDEACK